MMTEIDEQTQNVKKILSYIFTTAEAMHMSNGEIITVGITCIQAALLEDVDIEKYAGYIKNTSLNIIQTIEEMRKLIDLMENKQKNKR